MGTAVEEKPKNGQLATEERSITYIPIGEKDPLTLTVGLVEKFLCVKTRSGKIAGREDIMKFMMLCKAQGLNPWVNDAYLVGYDSNDGPKFQLISAHQALLKRAELSNEYDGMESGVCVTNKDGEMHERQGDLVLKGETLVGGWARVHRRDRKIPSYDCLSLATFSTGKSRWSDDPAGMIVKCAEASAMRKAFPSTLAQMFCREEMERQIEYGNRDRTHRNEDHAEQSHASKSEAIASVLARRMSQQDQASTHKSVEIDAEVVNGAESSQQEASREPELSRLEFCAESMQEIGLEVIKRDGFIFAKLPNGAIVKVTDGDPGPVDEATQAVNVNDDDALIQISNIVDRSKKTR